MTSLSLSSITQPLSRALHRYHVVIFVLVIIGGLAAAIFTMSTILQASSQPSDTGAQAMQFDAATIEQINDLRTRDESAAALDFPSGRINPFVE